ncbi:D-alanyl-D-alanine carboxypeptidase family protein [Microbacterium sp. bgisy207]|uniref:D-alanyl-D-alanine carboxypeptidase family protein n=1 Tax=Microbacterium sp. bgisy207 TaxID=3413800 RepID=UPI003EB80342
MTDTEAPTAPGPTDTDAVSGAAASAAVQRSDTAALQWARPASPAGPRRPVSDSDPGDLLEGMPRRSLLRGTVIGPTLIVLAVVAAYAGVTLLWPLTAVMPTAQSAEVAPMTASLAAPAWPAEGSAAVAVDGFESTAPDGTIASTSEEAPLASITKLVTALMVLDRQPLAIGESGPEYAFGSRDRSTYWNYRARGESALDVPVGESLTEYQMLQGMLIGSANNYASRLADQFWPTDAVFESAAADWLRTHGISGITVVEPTGIDADNVGTPAGVIALSRKAMANPVIAEIVATPVVTLPGAGEVENTNDLLADPGVVGIKTGTLFVNGREVDDLATAKDVMLGDTTVRMYATVLAQPTDEERDSAARSLLAQLEAELTTPYVVPAGTVVGTIQTAWGSAPEIRTATDATVVLWNGAASSSTAALTVGEWDAGSPAGTFTLSGPLGSTTVEAALTSEIEQPSPWWRLTHPLELFGLID